MTLSIKKKTLRKVVSSLTMLATVVSMSGIMALSSVSIASAAIADGAIIKSNATNSDGTPTIGSLDVYIVKLVGAKKFKRLILNPTVFTSYGHLNWGNIQTVSQAVMDEYTTSALVRVDTDPAEKVYAMAPNGDIGAKSWVNLTSAQFLGATGSDADAIYTINAVDGGNYTAVADVTTTTQLATFYSAGTLPGVVPVPAGALTVALSASTPASTIILSTGTTLQQAQVLIPFTTVNFTASADGDVKVTNLKFTRTGIAADSNLANTYLYDGATKLTDGGSISSKVVTFNNASGIFTVSAGATKAITLKGDLDSAVGAGKTIGFNLTAATDVTSNAGSASGSFPIAGNVMSVANATDLGWALIAGSHTTPTGVDTDVSPQNDYTVWSFSLKANEQNLNVEKIVLTEVGSIAVDDLQNFKIYNGGIVVGTGASMNADKQVVFDLSASPLSILKGATKILDVHADIVKGSTRTFSFTLQYATDLAIKDTNYGVYAPSYVTLASGWTLVKPTGNYKISAGTLSVTKRTNSPSGNVSLDATGILLAKYDFKAVGEDVKVSNLRIAADTTLSTPNGLDNGMVFLNGVQVGSTKDIIEYTNTAGEGTVFTFGSSFIVPAGTTSLVEIKADIKSIAAASFAADNTIRIYLLYDAANNDNAQGVSSLSVLDVPSVDTPANTLTVKAGSLTFTKNASYGAQGTTAPATEFKVGSFQMLAGSSEGVNINSVTVAIEDATAYAKVSNLKLKIGTEQIGSIKVTPSTTNLFSVNVALTAGQSKVVDVYADILSGVAAVAIDADGYAVTGTGTTALTSTAVNASSVILQIITVASGALSVSYDSGNVLDTLAVGLTSGGTQMAKYKFASTYEAFTVSEIKVFASSELDRTTPRYDKTNIPDFLNVWLSYKDSTGTVVTTEKKSTFVNGMIDFTNLDLYVAANGTTSVTVYADLNAVAEAGYALTGDRPQISLAYYKANSGSMSVYERRTGKLYYVNSGATTTAMTWVADDATNAYNETDDTGVNALKFTVVSQGATDGAEYDIPLSDLNLTVADFAAAASNITYSAKADATGMASNHDVPMFTLFMDCDLDGALEGEIIWNPDQTAITTAATWQTVTINDDTNTGSWWANEGGCLTSNSSTTFGGAIDIALLTQTAKIVGASFSIYNQSNGTDGVFEIDNLVFNLGATATTAYGINSVEDDMGDLGTNYVLYKTKPTVTRVGAGSETSLVNGTNDLYRFNIAADNAGDVAVKGMILNLTGSNTALELGTLKLYKGNTDYTDYVTIGTSYGNAGYEASTDIIAATTAYEVYVSFTDEEVIEAGTSQNYTLKGLVGGAIAPYSISTYIQQDLTPVGAGLAASDVGRGTTYALAIATNNKDGFVWSDKSFGSTHSLTSTDWVNGYLVSTLGNGLAYTVSK